MPGWEDEPLGAVGSAAQIPTGHGSRVDTMSRAMGNSLASSPTHRGERQHDVPSLGQPDQAPLSIGQAAGTMAPLDDHACRSMQRVQRLDADGCAGPVRSPWQDVLTAVGGASRGGQGFKAL